MQATEEGLGNGETPIFPIHIFKLKEGINYNPDDPNYDLFKYSMKVSAKRLFPNYTFMDSPFNLQYYKPGRVETEVATMGCVESSEIIQYSIDGKLYIEPFSVAYNRIASKVHATKYSTVSEYIDVSDIDVKVADSYTGKMVKVNKFIRNSNIDNWKIVKFSDGYSITLTADHPLPVIGKGRTYVSDMQVGDKVKVAKLNVSEGNKLKTDFFKDEAWLLGMLVTDSSYSSAIVISIGLDELDIAHEIDATAKRLGYTTRWNEQHRGEKGDYLDISITGITNLKCAKEELASLFGAYKKSERYLTSELLNSSIEDRRKLLAGMIDGDGYTLKVDSNDGDRSSYFILENTNKALAMTQLALIRGLGIRAKLYRNKYSSRHNKKRFLIAFEITDGILKYMKCTKKINKALAVKHWNMSDAGYVSVVDIVDGCEENENSYYSYDVETESDRFDVGFIQSHNCRTRVIGNVYDKSKEIVTGRGNLSFTSINLPRLAIEASNGKIGHGDIKKFYELLDNMMDLVHRQLLERFHVQCRKHPRNYPFLMGQGIWIDSDKLNPDDDITDVLKHGTLSVGFIGLAETLKMLIGKHHGESEAAQKLGLEIIGHMRELTDKWSAEEQMNYGVIGTPQWGTHDCKTA